MKKNKKIFRLPILTSVLYLFASGAYSNPDTDLITLFPLDHYDQQISTWIKPSDVDYSQPLLTAEKQQHHFDIFYDHYFGSLSPWNSDYVNQILKQSAPHNLKTIEQNLIQLFDNQGKPDNKIGFGENFHPYTKNWIDKISYNMNVEQFDSISYQPSHRGIAIDNLHARALPTRDVHFYNHKLAGQGYPFDNLQMSALWAGTPVYIIGESRDHAWLFVLTPDFIAWVKSNGIARANSSFIDTWIHSAKNKLAAITRTETSMNDDKGQFLFSAYLGSVFPASTSSNGMQLMVPAADADHQAVIKQVFLPSENASIMPLTATPQHFANIMSTLIARPYGWGSMYFYNDCSAELKSLLTPFGIWLPRHSSDQVTVGKMVDMSYAPQEKRLSYLMENGQKFLTIVYIGGHVVLYIGNYPHTNKDSSPMAMTYQNIWGLAPNPPIRRAVIGQSVLFPMLLQYPEDTNLISLANKSIFQVSYLNESPTITYLLKQKFIDLKKLVYPDNDGV